MASIAGHHFISENPEAWRWLLASAALPALLITLLRWGTPESPRWLLRQGRFAEAHAIVHRYFGPHVLLGDEVVTATHKHIKTLFSSRYWRRTAFNSVFFVCLVIPWFVIYTWLPTIAQTIGLEDALTASLMLNALLIVGALLGLVLTHLLAHRKFLLGSFLLLAATLVVMACLPSGSSLTLLLFVLFSTTISAVSNLVGILPAESFPTDIRSLGVGFATAMSRLGAAVSTGPVSQRKLSISAVAACVFVWLITALSPLFRHLSYTLCAMNWFAARKTALYKLKVKRFTK